MGGGPGMGVSVGTEPQVTANECGAKFTRAFDNSFPHPRVTQLAGRPTPGRRSCNQHCCLRGQTKQSPGRSLGWAVAEAGPWSCRAPPSGAPAILLPAHLPPNTREAWASCLARPSRGDRSSSVLTQRSADCCVGRGECGQGLAPTSSRTSDQHALVKGSVTPCPPSFSQQENRRTLSAGNRGE